MCVVGWCVGQGAQRMRAGIVGSGEPTTQEITNAGCKKALKMVGKRERERGSILSVASFFLWLGEGGQVKFKIDVGCNFLSLAMIVSCWDAFLDNAYPND